MSTTTWGMHERIRVADRATAFRWFLRLGVPLGLAVAIANGIAVRLSAITGPYPLAGLVWVALALALFLTTFDVASAAGNDRHELRVRLLPGGRREALAQGIVRTATLVAAALAVWLVYVLLSAAGRLPLGALLTLALAPALAFTIAALAGSAFGTAFQGPYLSWSAVVGVAVTLLALRGTSFAALVGTPEVDRWMSLSPWCAVERLVAFAAGVTRPGLSPATHVAVAVAWCVVLAGAAWAATRWRTGRSRLTGESTRQRRLKTVRGY